LGVTFHNKIGSEFKPKEIEEKYAKNASLVPWTDCCD
jgi:hypothetical protein